MRETRYCYEALIYPSGGTYEVHVPDLGAYTQGDDLDDAVYMAQDLVDALVTAMVEDGDELPRPRFDRDAPDGGYVLLVSTDGHVPEVPEMGVQDAADILGVTPSRVYAMCRDGVLDSRKVGSTVLVSADSVRRRFDAPTKAGRPRKRDLATA